MTTFPHTTLIISTNRRNAGDLTQPSFDKPGRGELRIIHNLSVDQFTLNGLNATPLRCHSVELKSFLRYLARGLNELREIPVHERQANRDAWEWAYQEVQTQIMEEKQKLSQLLSPQRWQLVALRYQRRIDSKQFHQHLVDTAVSRQQTHRVIEQLLTSHGIHHGLAQEVHAKILANLSPDEAAPVAEAVDPAFMRRLNSRYTDRPLTLRNALHRLRFECYHLLE